MVIRESLYTAGVNVNWQSHYRKLLHNKGNYKQGEKTAFRWEKIIANEATDKELISEIYKQHLQLNSRKINGPIKKYWMHGAGTLGRPRGMEWGGRREEGS